MKVLFSSDWHLDAVTAGVAREEEILGAVSETVKAAEQQKVDLYVMSGDLTDPDTALTHPAVGHAVGVAMTLDRLGIDQAWIPGNHDVVESGALHHTMLALKRVTRVFDLPSQALFGSGFKVAFLPYTPRSHSYDPTDWVEKHLEPDVRLVVGHLNIEGITPGSETTEMARGRDVFYPVEAIEMAAPNAFMECGHYHERQTYRGVYIPGSLCRLSFGEQHNTPGYTIVEFPS